MFCNYILYKPKAIANNIRIFILSSLIVLCMKDIYLEVFMSPCEVGSLALAYG